MNQPLPNTPDSYTGTGYLVIRVSTADNAIPLEGAAVSVRGSEPDSSGVITVKTTDRSGLTAPIPLPAPPRSLSTVPGNVKPYATYNVDVDLAGYGSQYFQNFPVFDGITSIQNVNLIPLSKNGIPDGYTPDAEIFFESENPNL